MDGQAESYGEFGERPPAVEGRDAGSGCVLAGVCSPESARERSPWIGPQQRLGPCRKMRPFLRQLDCQREPAELVDQSPLLGVGARPHPTAGGLIDTVGRQPAALRRPWR